MKNKYERKEWKCRLRSLFTSTFSDTTCTVECACYLKVCANNHRCLSLRAQHFLARMTSVWLFFVLAVCILSGYIKRPRLCSTMPKRENHLLLYAGLPWNIAARSVQHLRANNYVELLIRRAAFKPQGMILTRGKQRKVHGRKGEEADKTTSPVVSCTVRCFPPSKIISHKIAPSRRLCCTSRNELMSATLGNRPVCVRKGEWCQLIDLVLAELVLLTRPYRHAIVTSTARRTLCVCSREQFSAG